jgi:hypothetical protein
MLNYPTMIVSEAGQHTDKAFRQVVDAVNAQQETLDATAAALKVAQGQIPTSAQLAKEFQLGGASPLNLTGLPGTPSQGIPAGSAPAHEFVTGVTASQGATSGVLTYGQPSAADLTNGTTGTGAVVLASLLGNGPFTVALAKLTGGGTNGSLSINSSGMVVSYTAPT